MIGSRLALSGLPGHVYMGYDAYELDEKFGVTRYHQFSEEEGVRTDKDAVWGGSWSTRKQNCALRGPVVPPVAFFHGFWQHRAP